MNARLYALQRQLGLTPGGPTEPADPAMTELIEGVTALVTAAIAKKGTQAPPTSARAAAFLRSLEPIAQAAVQYTAPLPARQSNAFPLESKVIQRDELGRIKAVEHTTATGRTITSTTRRDSLGRMISVLHEMNGRQAIAKIRRDGLGRVTGQTMTLVDSPATPSVSYDSDTATVGLLVKAIEDNAPADLLYESSFVPGRNPYGPAIAQRDASGNVYAINVGNQQLPVDQIRSRPSNVVVECDAEGRPYISINRWKMRVVYDVLARVQALEPMDEGE